MKLLAVAVVITIFFLINHKEREKVLETFTLPEFIRKSNGKEDNIIYSINESKYEISEVLDCDDGGE